MIHHRKLTAEEHESLVQLLEKLDRSVADKYEYPIKDLVEYLRNYPDSTENEVVELDGEPLRYRLHFSSSPETWSNLCGRAGIYIIDAKTLESLDFEVTLMN